jgi:hypothetical protein
MQIATGSIDITPDWPVCLAGFAHRKAPIGDISSRLEANAVAFQDGNGRYVLLLSLDLLFTGAPIVNFVHEFCRTFRNIPPADIAIIASHTHYAPATDPSKPLLGEVDGRYIDFLIARLRTLLEGVLSAPAITGAVEKKVGALAGNVNRRLKWPLPRLGRREIIWGEPIMAPNLRGARDETATFHLFKDAAGAAQAVVWHWACHPSMLPDSFAVSADFVGEVRSVIRQQVGADVPVVFLQGFAGDIFPYVGPVRIPPVSQWLRTAVFGLSCDTFETAGHQAWLHELLNGVRSILGWAATRRAISGHNRSARTAVSLSAIVTDCGRDTPVHLGRLCVGDVLELLTVEAEPLIGLRDMVPFEDALCVGYAETAFGYWPTEKQRREGGYEGNGFLKPFSLTGRLAAGLDRIFENAISQLRNPL